MLEVFALEFHGGFDFFSWTATASEDKQPNNMWEYTLDDDETVYIKTKSYFFTCCLVEASNPIGSVGGTGHECMNSSIFKMSSLASSSFSGGQSLNLPLFKEVQANTRG